MLKRLLNTFVLFITLQLTNPAILYAAEALKNSDIKQMITSGQATVIDVREKDELTQGMIQSAQWLPTSEIKKKGPQFQEFMAKLSKDKTVLVYCASGGRSGKFTDELITKGFKAHNIGGFAQLKSEGMPTTSDSGAPTAKSAQPKTEKTSKK